MNLTGLMLEYVQSLNQQPEYQDGIQMSAAEIAQREIEAFIKWLEANNAGTGED